MAPAPHPAIRPRRSVLYMPGSNSRAIEKAASLPIDGMILDLEDAVAPDAKASARQGIAEAVKSFNFEGREIVIRINGLSSPWWRDDLEMALSAKPHAILVPKVNGPGDLSEIGQRMASADTKGQIALWAMMETPHAMFRALDIASFGPRLNCLVMGTNDLVKELHAQHTPDRSAIMTGAGLCLLAARAAGIDILDGVYNDIHNGAGFAAVCAQGRAMGFDGKTLIHPSQIETANAAFAPSTDEVDAARRILAAFALPDNQGKGAIALDGRMVELLHAEMAKRTVRISDAIATLSRRG